MDFEIYLSLTGEKQGEVIGPVTSKGRGLPNCHLAPGA